MCGVSVFAVTSITKSTFTASADFSSISGVTYLSIELKEIGTDISKTSFTFNTSASALGIGTTWYTANDYAIIYTTWTSGSAGRLLIYTDNTASDANPQYVSTGNPAGLLVSTATNTTADPLQLCWRITDISTTTTQILWTMVGNEMKLYCGPNMPNDYYVWLWIKDKGYGGNWYNTDNAYATVKSFDLSGSWIQHAESSWSSVPSPDYFYLGVNYERARAGLSYKTTTLRFDLVFD